MGWISWLSSMRGLSSSLTVRISEVANLVAGGLRSCVLGLSLSLGPNPLTSHMLM